MTLRRFLTLFFIATVAFATIVGLLDVWGVIDTPYNSLAALLVTTSVVLAVSIGSILLVTGVTFGPEDPGD